MHAYVYTPRRTTILYPNSKPKHTFSPTIIEYSGRPPSPPPLRRPDAIKKQVRVEASELEEKARALRAEADSLMDEFQNAGGPPLGVQLGQLLLTKDDYIKRILSAWDTKNKGEFQKGEFRVNLRNTGIQTTAGEADALFDSWDDDKGGSLDMKELKLALIKCQNSAKAWNDSQLYDPNITKANALRKQAVLADQAAKATAEAAALEAELNEFTARMHARADVRLGALLSRRKIRAGAVVTNWARGKGEHAGELSKKEFREAVQALGMKETGPTPTTAADIDAVFDTFDEDGGGYMDADEAKEMVKGLQLAAEGAEHDKFLMERRVHKIWAQASKKAAQAFIPVVDDKQTPEMAMNTVKPEPTTAEKAAEEKKHKRDGLVAKKKKKTGEAPASAPAPSAAMMRIPLEGIKEGIKAGVEAVFGSERKKLLPADNSAQVKLVTGRLMNITLANAFNSWRSHLDWTKYYQQIFEQAGRAFVRPFLITSLTIWQKYIQDQTRIKKTLRRSISMIMKGDERILFNQWRLSVAVNHMRGQMWSAALKAFIQRSKPQMLKAFQRLRKHQIERGFQMRLAQSGPCAAAAFWIQANSLDACKCLRRNHQEAGDNESLRVERR
mmetsp:Transcript_50785/g.101067  ORF Transcript_50785/g.101067 Transcript_50785/m.101067 type:complete len:613 (-) Transcript_50785:240-2078(-)